MPKGIKGFQKGHEQFNKRVFTREERLGKKHSKETIEKIRNACSREKHNNWKGGITPENVRIRSSVEYRLWRKSVFERDKYQCIWGGKEHGDKLQADHIKPFCDYPELRLAIDNGRTLCINCHKQVHKRKN